MRRTDGTDNRGAGPHPGEAAAGGSRFLAAGDPVWLAALALAASTLLMLVAYFPLLADDAYIPARYVRQLYDGHGLVFNVGERINAVTSPLLTLAAALVYPAGSEAVNVYRITASILMAWTLATIARRAYSTVPPRLAFLAVALASPFVCFWAIGGLETPLLLCACAWLAWLGLAPEGDGARSAVGIIALGTLAVLTRYDSVLFVAPLAFANLWRHRRDARVVATAVVGTLVVTAWLAFTRLYYGDLLPTSFYVKLPEDAALGNLGRGAFYAASFVVLSIAVPVALVRIGARRSDRDAHEAPRHMPIALAAGLVAEMAYAIVAGDTHMMYAYRLFVPYLPCVVLLVTARRGAAKAARGWLAAAGVLACLLYQVLLGACLYYLSENPNLSLLFRRQQIGDELYEFSTVGARHTRPFLGAVRESAREIEAHWRTTAASKSRPMRIAVHTGGMLPYALPEAYALELLVSYRHRCRPDLASFADYAQAVQNADAPSSPDRLFGTEGAGWQLIDKREFTVDGWQRKPYRIRVDMWYQPRPAAPTLPTTIDGPCLGG